MSKHKDELGRKGNYAANVKLNLPHIFYQAPK
jgi:hypothetical protein